MAALRSFEIGHMLFKISILVGSIVSLLWISKKVWSAKFKWRKVIEKKLDGTRYEIRFSPPGHRVSLNHFFSYASFLTRILLESFNKAIVHLNGCARACIASAAQLGDYAYPLYSGYAVYTQCMYVRRIYAQAPHTAIFRRYLQIVYTAVLNLVRFSTI
jgi:hypothetical protein